jgi:hypothetical protein
MRRSHIWLLIAFFWMVDAILATVKKHWSAAGMAAAVALIFFAVAMLYRRRDALPRRDRVR